MENGKKEDMGINKTRNKYVAGKTDVGVQEPIYGSKQNARHKESNFQRKTDQARLSQRFRLLPKGTYLILSWTAVCRTARTVVWEEGENPSYSILL